MNVSNSYAAESCEKFFLLNLGPNSKCETKSKKTLYKEANSITIMKTSTRGIKWHKPSKGEELTLTEARAYCKAKGYRLPNVAELENFVEDTYSERLGGITSCTNQNRSFFAAEGSSDLGTHNIVPVEGKASWSQRNFEIAAFDLSSNYFVTRYEGQRFNAMCVEDVDKAPSFQAKVQFDCSEYWLASPKISVGTTCRFDDSADLTKTANGFEFSDGTFLSFPDKNESVKNLDEAKDSCDAKNMDLINAKTLEYFLDGLTDKVTKRKPQVFCVGEFAESESALVEDFNMQNPREWYFPTNKLRNQPFSIVGYRVVCEK